MPKAHLYNQAALCALTTALAYAPRSRTLQFVATRRDNRVARKHPKISLMLRVGFLGCGDVAHRRARSMRELNEQGEPVFEMVAACDLSPHKSAEFVARFGGELYSSPKQMVDHAPLDALWICTPPSVRGSGENVALAAGVALWIEPPIAPHIRAANALALQIKKSGVPVCVGAPHRYSPELERLKRVLSGKGAPRIERWNGDLSANLLRTAWRNEAKNGNVWLDGAWPMLDLLRFLGIETSKGSAKSNDSNGVAALESQNGALVSLGVSRFEEARELLVGSGGDAHISVRNWTTSPRVEVQLERETTIWNGEDALAHQLRAFARLLNTGKRTENRSTFADALLTFKMALALK